MADTVYEIREIYSRIVDGFRLNHAKVMHLMLDKTPREASQIMRESNLDRGSAYPILSDLVEMGLLKQINSNPKRYAAEEIRKNFQDKVRQRTLTFMEDRLRLQEIIDSRRQGTEEEFTLAFGLQTKLVDTKTKEVKILEEDDARRLKNNLNALIREKEKKDWMTAYNK